MGRFNEEGADGKVVLQQLGCSSGGIVLYISWCSISPCIITIMPIQDE